MRPFRESNGAHLPHHELPIGSAYGTFAVLGRLHDSSLKAELRAAKSAARRTRFRMFLGLV